MCSTIKDTDHKNRHQKSRQVKSETECSVHNKTTQSLTTDTLLIPYDVQTI